MPSACHTSLAQANLVVGQWSLRANWRVFPFFFLRTWKEALEAASPAGQIASCLLWSSFYPWNPCFTAGVWRTSIQMRWLVRLIHLYFLKEINVFEIKELTFLKTRILFPDFPVPECPFKNTSCCHSKQVETGHKLMAKAICSLKHFLVKTISPSICCGE